MALPTEDTPTDTGRRLRLYVVLLLTTFALLAGVSSAQQAKETRPQRATTLETIRQVRELPSENARFGYPDSCARRGNLCRQNAGRSLRSRFHGRHLCELGCHDPCNFTPARSWRSPASAGPEILLPRSRIRKIQVLGQGPLPAPKRVTGEEFVTGVEDSQFVEIEGVVRSAAESQGRLLLHVASGTVIIPVYVLDYKPIPGDLVGAKVVVQGVSGGTYNPRMQFLGATLLVPGLKNLTIEVPASADPFSIPLRPIHLVAETGSGRGFQPGRARSRDCHPAESRESASSYETRKRAWKLKHVKQLP